MKGFPIIVTIFLLIIFMSEPKVAPGAVGTVSGTPEYVITLKIAKKLKKLLLKGKAIVVMTRETHDINKC